MTPRGEVRFQAKLLRRLDRIGAAFERVASALETDAKAAASGRRWADVKAEYQRTRQAVRGALFIVADELDDHSLHDGEDVRSWVEEHYPAPKEVLLELESQLGPNPLPPSD